MRVFQLYSYVTGVWTSHSFDKRSTTTTACNNSPQLCGRSYGNITHLGAHDSPFVSNATNNFNIAGNQFYSSTDQLNAGVRLLTAQIHNPTDGTSQLHLCHTSCVLYDAGTLLDWLSSIKAWLDGNPNDVVTLLFVNSDGTSSATLDSVYKSSGISKYTFTPSFNSPPTSSSWPTLSSLISSNTRLITFVDSLPSGDAGIPYIIPEFTFVFENQYNVTAPADFSCDPNRPPSLTSVAQAESSNMLFLQNHFLDYAIGTSGLTVPNVTASNNTNSPDVTIIGSLGASANQCSGVYGRAANFLLVDWFDRGPALSTVDRLNGVVGSIVGRSGPGASGNGQNAGNGQNGTGQTGGSPNGGNGSTTAPKKGSGAIFEVGSLSLCAIIFAAILMLV
jgi:hypothetical protein